MPAAQARLSPELGEHRKKVQAEFARMTLGLDAYKSFELMQVVFRVDWLNGCECLTGLDKSLKVNELRFGVRCAQLAKGRGAEFVGSRNRVTRRTGLSGAIP